MKTSASGRRADEPRRRRYDPRMDRVRYAALLAALLACAPKPATPAAAPESTSAAACPEPKPTAAEAPREPELAEWIRQNYDKHEHTIPMRDGARLFTAVYSPKDRSRPYPILLTRTPYSVAPYGEGMRATLGPSEQLARDGYIFVYQDVRGRMMSEGTFLNMTPHRPDKRTERPELVDESSDTHDTITWLLEHVPNHNGRVGMWGISYPGFYAAAGMIDHHPALVAVSPQAPIADWYFDDFYHHGAFFLPHFFNFFVNFGRPRGGPSKEWPERFNHGTPDGYEFFARLGALANVDRLFFKGQVEFWRDIVAHPTYDDFWRARNILPHLRRVAPAVMVVGGWFDAEDLHGPLAIYREIERHNPDVYNVLVMGPWPHGGWARSDGDHLGNISFGAKTAQHYRAEIERRFFDFFLKLGTDPQQRRSAGAPDLAPPLPEATVFDTGALAWRDFTAWPPPQLTPRRLYFQAEGALALDAPPTDRAAADRFVSDPRRPVPFSEDVHIGMTREYMTDDQRFAARRPDVLVYQTPPLSEDLTVAGPIAANLWVATSARDADWVVKLIDVFPPDAPDHEHLRPGKHMGESQMMVRSEVLRGRYRDSYERPKPFTPGAPTAVRVPLQDVLHTFKKGHRVMVQLQSTWFPLVDRNPQSWVDNIFLARDQDFTAATHTVHRSAARPTHLEITTLAQ
jgi:putative CocE/NonD family hydrolase